MNTISATTRQMIRDYQFSKLFIEELGWNRYSGEHYITANDDEFLISAIAEKAGFVVYTCTLDTGEIPDHATRRRIEREVRKLVHEHLIIFHDSAKTHQIWQWIRRETGKPEASREHSLSISQTGEALCQRVIILTVSLEEEEGLTILAMQERAKKAFDVEKVTKRFYDNFKKEHDQFLKFLNGIPDKDMERWYVSVMLNRLMFIYFIQKKGFLGGDQDYLRNQLVKSKKTLGKDRYYSEFLCPLFFEGFAKTESDRSAQVKTLLGQVPYLNGGIFLPHQVEQLYGQSIEVPDKAFDKLFEFFDAYRWHLDERPLRRDDEINPDVLGYIFEKYINQKQMGAYYTKEDITEYISKNTVVPFLLDRAIEKCKVAFEGDQSVWNMLRDDPDRYIYEPVRMGVLHPDGSVIPESYLPEFVQEGMHDPKARTFNNDYNFGRASLLDEKENELTLPTETWREYVDRRKRCLDLRQKLVKGEIHEVNDLVTNNLDIRQFIQDLIDRCEGPDLLNTIWSAIKDITILDPTCGSGAFLFAALNILYPLYDACLERMRFFLSEWGDEAKKHHPNYTKWFTQTLENVDCHPNHKYFILKSIIVQNLYGVDIMEEATEICKLRFFLKLVAQVEKLENLEPLPDIDFNIRSGNAIVGFVTRENIRESLEREISGQGKMVFGVEEEALKKIDDQAEIVDGLVRSFRSQQTKYGGTIKEDHKAHLRNELKILTTQLDYLLAVEYGIKTSNVVSYDTWCDLNRPFHWFAEFHEILSLGGFDVVIGNPPYLEKNQVDYIPIGYSSYETGTIHAVCVECGLRVLKQNGNISMILPMALTSTQRMENLQNLLEHNHSVWYSNFAWRPGKLFDNVNRALTIFVGTSSAVLQTYSTNYQKWTSADRDGLFKRINYIEIERDRLAFWVPKLGASIEQIILDKCILVESVTSHFLGTSSNRIYYRTTGGLYWKVFTDFTPAFRLNGKSGHSSRETWTSVSEKEYLKPLIAVLSSNLYWWWYSITSNLRDLNPSDVQNFPISEKALKDKKMKALGQKYLDDIIKNSTMLIRQQKQTGKTETQSFKIQKSKPIINEIDQVLAQHYGFTDGELDFLINYDVKYRIGTNREGHNA